MSFDFPQPLRLAVGSHQAGSGRGCAMNVISYENGDKQITDYPACADKVLAHVVQGINDTICAHAEDKLLCADCSVRVLELAHRTVGTALPWSMEAKMALYRDLAQWAGITMQGWHHKEVFLRMDIAMPYFNELRTIEDAHRLIDKFEELTGIKAKPVPAEVTEQAVTKMREMVDA